MSKADDEANRKIEEWENKKNPAKKVIVNTSWMFPKGGILTESTNEEKIDHSLDSIDYAFQKLLTEQIMRGGVHFEIGKDKIIVMPLDKLRKKLKPNWFQRLIKKIIKSCQRKSS